MRSRMPRRRVHQLLAPAVVALAFLLAGCCLIDYLDDVLPGPGPGPGPTVGFGIQVEPATLTLETDGAVRNVVVTITRTGGYDGGVSLEVLDLPTGVTHDVRGTDTATKRTVRFAAFRGAALDATVVTVRASASGIEAVVDQPITLTVTGPDHDDGSPPPPATSGGFTGVSAGGYHSLALDEHGNAWAWGWNRFGQLADGSTTNRLVPVAVFAIAARPLAYAAAGGLHSVALDGDSVTWAVGFNEDGQLGDGTRFARSTPVHTRLPQGVVLTSVSAGDFHTLALDQHGDAWAWGWNGDGQLGDGTTSEHLRPVRVRVPPGVTFTSLAAGGSHSLALDQDGAVWGWGANGRGEVGDGHLGRRLTPVRVAMPTGVTITSIAAGEQHSVALDQHGHAWSWGRNEHGQLGEGSITDRRVPQPVSMPEAITFSRIAAGGFHTLALDQHGRPWSWGRNVDGQLGNASFEERRTPIRVAAPEAIRFIDVAAGYHHSVALDELGNAWSWGRNLAGQLGIGSLDDNRSTPAEVRMP